MGRIGLKKKPGNAFWQRVALGVVCVLIACYTFYHLLGLFDAEMETYAAGVTTETRVLSYSGYIFRDEVVLTSDYEGVVDYRVGDGVKVSEGQAIATVYSEGSRSLRQEVRRMDDQIAVLSQSLEGSATIPEMGKLKQEAKSEYLTLVKRLAEGDSVGIGADADAFLVTLNRMDALVKEEQSAGHTTLRNLRETREGIMQGAGSSQTYYAERSGYFYAQADGYEELFSAAAITEQTFRSDDFFELVEQMEEESAVPREAYGKLCTGSEWKLVMPVRSEDASYFQVGGVYSGVFGENAGTAIPLTLEFTKEAPDRELTLLVFSADRMPENFSFDRCQNVSIEVESTSGIYVPKHVVVREGGGRGVYILRGSVVHFRYVEIVYEGDGYYLVRPNVVDEEHGRLFLKTNDMIILNGKNLFDGRVMD